MQETLSVIASVVSVIIGAFAIWLSVTFYRLSNKIAEDTKEASKGISASVARLESLFDRLYSDTFAMMKDTVSDMRKHIWPDKEQSADALAKIEEKADAKITDLRKQISTELSTVMSHLGRTDSKIKGFEDKLTDLIDRAIQQTRRVESEAQEAISMSRVLDHVQRFMRRYGETTVGRMFSHPLVITRFPKGAVMEALAVLLRERMIEADGDLNNPSTTIKLLDSPTRGSIGMHPDL